MSKLDKIFNILLFALLIVVLTPFINIELFNEDYLILHWNTPKTFADCFSDFHTKTTGGPYWRPVVWSSYFVTKFFFGMDGTPYHLTNILFYAAIISLLYIFFRKIGIGDKYAFVGLLIFALLPARELNFAWVPGRTDLFAAFFLLLATIFYIKSCESKLYAPLAILSFIFAILSKEIAFAGVAIPFLLYYLKRNDLFSLKYTIFSTLISLFVIASVLIYRSIFIGGTPFETTNFENISIYGIFKNFLIYLPLSIFNADLLEKLYFELTKLNFRILIPIFLVILYLSRNILVLIKSQQHTRKIFMFGLLWFVVFIAPALPHLMQWYGFVAYFGLFAAFLIVLDDKKFEKVKLAFAFTLFILLVLYNYSQAELWREVARKTNYALNDLAQKLPKNADTIYIIAAPDKINRINAMKIGLQEAISTHLNRKIEVLSPIRCELSEKSQIIIETDKNVGLIKLRDGFFKMQGTRSSYFGNNEKFEYEDAFAKFSIKNNKKSGSILKYELKSNTNYVFIFEGKKFINFSTLHFF